METWMKEYTIQLEKAVQEHPEDYPWAHVAPLSVPIVAARMRKAFLYGTYNKDGHAIKNTCKVFKIKHTYKDINHFIANHA